MRRFFLPVVVFAVAIVASVLAGRANDAAEPDDPADVRITDSLGTPLLSARRAPEWLRQPTTSDLLDRAVRRPIDALEGTAFACLSVHIDGQPVTDVAGEVPLTPGSIQRLLTLAALDTVGTGGFTTEVVRANDSVISAEGVLDGDLYLIGRADPVLSTNAYINQFDDGRAFTSLEELALTTVAALNEEGITSVSGRVVGVDGRYAGAPQVVGESTWTDVEIRSGEIGVTGGLLVNNGITNTPDPADPSANVRTSDPVVHAATEFATLLAAAGVIDGGGASGEAPPASARQTIASITSPPLDEIAARAVLDGTTAEMLWREIAVRNGGSPDSYLDLFGGVNSALEQLGLLEADDFGNVPKVDGSGLSLTNKNRCRTHTSVLDPNSSGLAAGALPTTAESAISACTPAGLTSLRVLAAARPEVTSMAGWAEASNGDIVSFSVMANWLPDDSGAYAARTVCDGLLTEILEAIAAHPSGPALDTLTPLDPVSAE
jgi:D-alanyl-D-alanine carboxypeptidase